MSRKKKDKDRGGISPSTVLVIAIGALFLVVCLIVFWPRGGDEPGETDAPAADGTIGGDPTEAVKVVPLLEAATEPAIEITPSFEGFLKSVHIEIERQLKPPPRFKTDQDEERVGDADLYLLGLEATQKDDARIAAWAFARAALIEGRPTYLNNLAFALARTGKYEEAITVLQLLHEEAPNARVKANLGRAYYETGRYEDSQRLLLDAVSVAPGNGAYHFALARAHDRMKDPRAFDEYWQSLRLDPWNADALAAVGVDNDRLSDEELQRAVAERVDRLLESSQIVTGEPTVSPAIALARSREEEILVFPTQRDDGALDSVTHRSKLFAYWLDAPGQQLAVDLAIIAHDRDVADASYRSEAQAVHDRWVGQNQTMEREERSDLGMWCAGVAQAFAVSRVEEHQVHARRVRATEQLRWRSRAAEVAAKTELETVHALWGAEEGLQEPPPIEDLQSWLDETAGQVDRSYDPDRLTIDWFPEGSPRAECLSAGHIAAFRNPDAKAMPLGPITLLLGKGVDTLDLSYRIQGLTLTFREADSDDEPEKPRPGEDEEDPSVGAIGLPYQLVFDEGTWTATEDGLRPTSGRLDIEPTPDGELPMFQLVDSFPIRPIEKEPAPPPTPAPAPGGEGEAAP